MMKALPAGIVFALAAIGAAGWFAPGAAAQVIFGGQVFIGGEVASGDDATDDRTEPDPSGPQLLEFSDGTRLHGALTALNLGRQELGWQRADASAPLAFPLAQVHRLSMASASGPDEKVHATVKFRGGDWLAAEVVGIDGGKVRLKFADGRPCTADRSSLEWIYFSKGAAAECYDGPTSLAGWTSGGGWSYRDGELRASAATAIGRRFEALPDQVEYRFEVDQGGGFNAFALTLHNRNSVLRGLGVGSLQITLRGTVLRVSSPSGGEAKTEQVDLSKSSPPFSELAENGAPGKKRPVLFRVFEDYTGGRLLVFINGRKAMDWKIGKGAAGKNGGGFCWQPMSWNADSEQTLSRIRIVPWDGRLPTDGESDAETSAGDQVFAGREMQEGKIASLAAGKLKIAMSAGAIEMPQSKVTLVRFRRPENPPDENPPVARLRLARRGELEAAGLDWRDGKFVVRTNFAGELALVPSAVREIEFLHASWTPPKTNDVIVFKNGDRLSGVLDMIGDGGRLRWRIGKADAPAEFETARASGVLIGFREQQPVAKSRVVARFRNGDWLAGDLVELDKERLILESPATGRIEIAHPWVQALSFYQVGQLPVSDGACDHEIWERGMAFEAVNSAVRIARTGAGLNSLVASSPWRYFDGAFSIEGTGGDGNVANGAHLGRVFEALPQRVELSFDVTTKRMPVYFSARLFSEADNPGYMLQFHSQGLFFYDMSPRLHGRPASQQQVEFSGKVPADAFQRHIRLLADRPSGMIAIIVDGVLITQIGSKPGEDPRYLGRGLMLIPQASMPCTFSNLWVGPWNGQIPGKTLRPEPSHETVVFANGDEARGTVRTVTPTAVVFDSEAGTLDLSVERLTMIDFRGEFIAGQPGTRLRLRGFGALSVSSYRIENGKVTCQSEVAGKLTLPLAAVQEVVFSPLAPIKTDGKATP